MTAEGADKVDDNIRWIASSERPSIDEFVEEIGVQTALSERKNVLLLCIVILTLLLARNIFFLRKYYLHT